MPSIEDELAEVVEALRTPAGPAPEFASREAILQDHTAFVAACHTTWKRLHNRAISRLLFHEGFLRADKARPLHPAIPHEGEYQKAVWRKVNDSLVWIVFGSQRHLVKRACLYRKRGDLLACNPDSVREMLDRYNADPLALAIWNDATSCVDLGDITLVKDGRRPMPEFIELKEGPVNAALVRALDEAPEIQAATLDALVRRHGKKARQQFDRMIRQKATGNQALRLMRDERGTDPVTGHEMSIQESPVAPEYYDDLLKDLMRRARTTPDGVLECVDDCLWIFAGYGNRDSALRSVERFAAHLEIRSGWWRSAASSHPRRDADKMRSLSTGMHRPLAVPLFLRPLEPDQIAGVALGGFRDNVLMYLDWDGFARQVERAGGQFEWASKKMVGRLRAMHRNLRPPLIRGGVATVAISGGHAFVTDPDLVQIFYDGLRPSVIARRLALERGPAPP